MPRINKQHGNTNRYSDEEKKKAVAILAQFGGGVTNEGVAAVQRLYPSASRSNMALWWNQWADEVVPKSLEIVIDDPQVLRIVESTDDLMFSTLNKLLKHANDDAVIKDAKMKDSMISIGILIDKLMMRAGISPELLSKCKRLIAVMVRKGYDPLSHLDDLIESYEQLPDAAK